jgi:mono/diheme cytochrome c family protein
MFRTDRSRGRALAAATVALALLVGCAQKMSQQPSLRGMEGTSLFPDGKSALAPPDDTVARGHLQDDTLLFTGKSDGADATNLPFPATRAVLERGRTRFDSFCAPCHGRAGDGNGIVVQRGFSPPPSYHIDRLRQAPVGHFFNVMTNGYGSMPAYDKQIPVRDRWAIAAYMRALQLSQAASLNDVPADERARLEAQP